MANRVVASKKWMFSAETATSTCWPMRAGERGWKRPTALAAVALVDSSAASGSPESTVLASRRKCTMISEPSASINVTSEVNRELSGTPSLTIDASSKSSGRMPMISGLPSYERNAGLSINDCGDRANECAPNVTVSPSASTCRSQMARRAQGTPYQRCSGQDRGWSMVS